MNIIQVKFHLKVKYKNSLKASCSFLNDKLEVIFSTKILFFYLVGSYVCESIILLNVQLLQTSRFCVGDDQYIS